MIRFALALALLVAGVLPAGAQTVNVKVSVTPNAAAYVAGNCLGGVQTLAGAVQPGGDGGAILQDIVVVDSAGQDAALDFFLFTAPPVGTYTDHAACAIAAGDQPFAFGPFSVTSCALAGASSPGLCRLGNIAQLLQVVTGTAAPITSPNLYAVAIVRGTPTYGTATIVERFGFLPDRN